MTLINVCETVLTRLITSWRRVCPMTPVCELVVVVVCWPLLTMLQSTCLVAGALFGPAHVASATVFVQHAATGDRLATLPVAVMCSNSR